MDNAEFKRLLRIGHGRAVVLLWDEDDDTPYRDAILEACYHNQAVEPAVDVRGIYMGDVMIATGNEDFYEPYIIEALLNLPEDVSGCDRMEQYYLRHDAQQLYYMIWSLVLKGNQQARAAIYQKAATSIMLADMAGAHQIVRMDSMAGFEFAAEHVGQYLLDHPTFDVNKVSIEYFLFEPLEEQLGLKPDLEKLAQTYADNAAITACFDAVRSVRVREAEPYKRDSNPKDWNYHTLQQKLAEGMRASPHISFRAWGRNASESDLAQAAADLLNKTDENELIAYLSIFHECPFPLDPMLLVPFTRHVASQVIDKAFKALAAIEHPSVRIFALDSIRDHIHSGEAVRLLNKNFEVGDWPLIENLTAQSFDDPHEHHNLQMCARDIAESHPGPECIGTLVNLYEYGPCAWCRSFIVQMLHSYGAFTDAMREECAYDANHETRDWITNNFQAASDEDD